MPSWLQIETGRKLNSSQIIVIQQNNAYLCNLEEGKQSQYYTHYDQQKTSGGGNRLYTSPLAEEFFVFIERNFLTGSDGNDGYGEQNAAGQSFGKRVYEDEF